MNTEKTESNSKLEQYVNLQRSMANEKRVKILIVLTKEKKSWSQLMYELDLRNPKLLHDHISVLINSNLIEKDQKGFYNATKFGKTWLRGNLSLMEKINEHE